MFSSEVQNLRVAAYEWPPYMGKALAGGGKLLEKAQLVLKRAGYSSVVTFLPWFTALEKTRNGEFDVLIGASYTAAREQDLYYPFLLHINTMHFFVRRGGITVFSSLQGLCPGTIGVRKGSNYQERFENKTCLTVLPKNSFSQNIADLYDGNVDMLIGEKEVMSFAIQQHFSSGGLLPFIPLEPAFEIDPVYIVVSKHVQHGRDIAQKLRKEFSVMQHPSSLFRIQ